MSGVGSAVSEVECPQSSEKTLFHQRQEKMMSSHLLLRDKIPTNSQEKDIIKIQHLHMTSALLVHYDMFICAGEFK